MGSKIQICVNVFSVNIDANLHMKKPEKMTISCPVCRAHICDTKMMTETSWRCPECDRKFEITYKNNTIIYKIINEDNLTIK